MSEFHQMLKSMSPEEGVAIAKCFLQSSYTRQIEGLQQALDAFDEINWKGIEKQWYAFMQASEGPEEGLALFTQYLSGILDGGDAPVPPQVKRHLQAL